MGGGSAYRGRAWHRWILATVLIVSLGGAVGRADVVNIGVISFDQYNTFKDATLGGNNIIAHYTLNANAQQFAPCFTAADIRWLQLVDSSKDTGFTPNPNRPFIDPRSDQPGGFDNLPWYDATFNNLADAQANTNRQFGAGPYLLDTPRVLLSRGPYSFTAQTLVVVQMNKMIAVLGGFQWGFTIGADMMTVTNLPLTPLTDNAALRASFNTALGLDFPAYSIKDFSQIWPPSIGGGTNTPTISVVPEPGVWTLSVLAVVVCGPVLARGRKAA